MYASRPFVPARLSRATLIAAALLLPVTARGEQHFVSKFAQQ